MNVIGRDTMEGTVNGTGGGVRVGLVGLVVAALAAGCGSSGKTPPVAAAQKTTSPATIAVAASQQDAAEGSNASAASYDYQATAGCLDQYSGDGSQLGTDMGAKTISISGIPASGSDTGSLSAYLLFFRTQAQARAHLKDFSKGEEVLLGSVLVTGSAIAQPYARRTVLSCMQVQGG